MFSERGIGEFKRTLELADPPPMVMFETRDAVAYPYRAAEIVPVGGTTAEGHIRDVTPTASGELTRAVGATIQTADGTTFAQVADDEIKLQVGNKVLSITDSGFAFTGGSVTHNGTTIDDTHTHGGVAAGPSSTGVPN